MHQIPEDRLLLESDLPVLPAYSRLGSLGRVSIRLNSYPILFVLAMQTLQDCVVSKSLLKNDMMNDSSVVC